MNRLGSIGEFLEKLSEDYERIPLAGYAVAGCLIIVLLIFSGLIIPRLKIKEKRKIQVYRVCAWCMIGLYGGQFWLRILFMGCCFFLWGSFLHGSVPESM